ncbi:MAG: hypothetical protein WBP81_37510, partial [Solirubrobacteraceae bacterium]
MSRTSAVADGIRAPRDGTQQTGDGPVGDVLVVFGITGDLAKVKTFRSLYRLELLRAAAVPGRGRCVDDWTDDTTLDVSLEPERAALAFAPGMFIFLAFAGPGGWQRHPFSVASAPSERRLRVSIKAAGDYTHDLHDNLKTGTPAKVAGPFQGVDYRRAAGGPPVIVARCGAHHRRRRDLPD